jgi:hypothetical protein
MSNHTGLATVSDSASALSAIVGIAGAMMFASAAACLVAATVYAKPLLRTYRHIDVLITAGRWALLALLYLIVGTNKVAWTPPSGGAANNMLRVAMGLLVNVFWLDQLSLKLFPRHPVRDRLLRPAVAVLVLIGTLTVASSPGAREFALAVVALALLVVYNTAVVAWCRERMVGAERQQLLISLGLFAVAGIPLLLLGELLSPSYFGAIGNGGALIFMLLGHLLVAAALFLCPRKTDSASGQDTAASDDGDDAYAGVGTSRDSVPPLTTASSFDDDFMQ